ncbi:MAG: TetR/AcrR family transcriptional regulator [Spirochaetaceae bacterium]
MANKISIRKQKFLHTQERLYIAGLKLFQTLGYKDCDLRTICKEAGIGLGTFYNYFDDKLNLYLYVFEKEFRILSRIVFDNNEMEKLKGLNNKELISFILNYQLNIHQHSQLFYREAGILLIQEPKVKELKEKLYLELLESITMLFNYLNISIKGKNTNIKLTLLNNTIEETIYFILNKPIEEQRVYLEELGDLIYSYLFMVT